MTVMAFNGSPRKKKWNTVTLLKHVLKGAASLVQKPSSYSYQLIMPAKYHALFRF